MLKEKTVHEQNDSIEDEAKEKLSRERKLTKKYTAGNTELSGHGLPEFDLSPLDTRRW